MTQALQEATWRLAHEVMLEDIRARLVGVTIGMHSDLMIHALGLLGSMDVPAEALPRAVNTLEDYQQQVSGRKLIPPGVVDAFTSTIQSLKAQSAHKGFPWPQG